TGPVRLKDVAGFSGRTNDVVYCPPLSPTFQPSTSQSVVVYFGGDVQDFPENMNVQRDNAHYIKWNLEAMATILGENFTHEHIVIIRPSRMEFRMFSCFDNFVPSDNMGSPEHTPNHNALNHLQSLLCTISNVLSDNVCKRELLRLDRARIMVVGFSKGCVVLNQLVYEFHYLSTLMPDDSTLMHFVRRISDMFWLDGGHAGGKNTWITSRSLLETLTRLCISIHVHVTPYQVGDEKRPWIRREEKAFSDMLQKLGAPINRTLHFEGQASLLSHFQLLSEFIKSPSPNK
ncbi:hypothetical protein AAG570_002306, partial [Ranatra chinensis]